MSSWFRPSVILPASQSSSKPCHHFSIKRPKEPHLPNLLSQLHHPSLQPPGHAGEAGGLEPTGSQHGHGREGGRPGEAQRQGPSKGQGEGANPRPGAACAEGFASALAVVRSEWKTEPLKCGGKDLSE